MLEVSYTLYIREPVSRNLDEKVDPEATELRRLEDANKIDYLMQSVVEDLQDLLPQGYTVEYTKERQ